jgi:hypothetical protein
MNIPISISIEEANIAGNIKALPKKAVDYVKSGLASADKALDLFKPAQNIKSIISQQILGSRLAPGTAQLESRKVRHYELYVTDGYINVSSGSWPQASDRTSIPGWSKPIYIWGFTDIDPNILGNKVMSPSGSVAPAGSTVGNAKFPGPFLESMAGEDVYITVNNRGLFQDLQEIQEDFSLHLNGVRTQSSYDGFPETSGGYGEKLRYFWMEDWYLEKGSTTKERDDWWNGLKGEEQQNILRAKPSLIRPNQLNQNGGIYSLKNAKAYPEGVGSKLPYGTPEDWSQFTYYFRPDRPGTFIYACHMSAHEHVQMGLYGSFIVRPNDGSKSVYGLNTNTDYDKEYTFILSEFDSRWHNFIEGGASLASYSPANWRPDLWFINGRAFPQTVNPFAWNSPKDGIDAEPRYNACVKAKPNQKILIRYINTGYQNHPIHQQGWGMRIVGSDGYPLTAPIMKATISINSGESYEAITIANPVYGATDNAGSPLSIPAPAPVSRGTTKWRQIFPINNSDEYKNMTNGIYPGGMMTLIEAVDVPNASKPSWMDPYTEQVEELP